jgi:hypothetical protein
MAKACVYNNLLASWGVQLCTVYDTPSLALQEENKILDRMHRQKVAEVEKLTQTVRELEEAVLAGGAAANAVRDYQRKVQEMNVINDVLNPYICVSHDI